MFLFVFFQIVLERVSAHFSLPVRPTQAWNSEPGALNFLPDFSPLLSRYPFYMQAPNMPQSSPALPTKVPMLSNEWKLEYSGDFDARGMFTAVIYASKTPSPVPPSSSLYRLIKNLTKSAFLQKVSFFSKYETCFC